MIRRAMGSLRRTGLGASALGVLAGAAALAASLAFASPAIAECPNEALRRESNVNSTTGKPYSEGLPDCRAYEMVSPLYKQTQNASGFGVGGFPVAPDGETVAWDSLGAFSNPENDLLIQNPYLSQRGPLGWGTSSSIAPRNLVDGPSEIGMLDDSSPDLRSARATCGTSPLVPGDRGNGTAFTLECARLERGGSWTSTPAYRAVTGGSLGNPEYVGGSADLSRLFFQPTEHLSVSVGPPDADTEVERGGGAGIYEIAACCTPFSKLRLVNVANSGSELVLLHEGGSGDGKEGPLLGDARYPHNVAGSDYHAISESGATVFFTATPANSEIQTVYARINCGTNAAHGSAPCTEDGNGEWFETVTVSNPSHEACKECKEATPQDATFQGASADGSKVFFTTKQQLLSNEVEGAEGVTPNLYEYDFNRPEGAKLVLLSPDTEGAKVEGVVRISSDGSHVYFGASSVLTGGEENGNGEKALPGQHNLYAYDTVTDKTKFVATSLGVPVVEGIGTTVSAEHTRYAQTTPSGSFLVFSSRAQMAGDLNKLPDPEKEPAYAVYRYDFETGALTWVSHAVSGLASPNEGQDAFVARLPGQIGGAGAYGNVNDWNRAISEDGERVIFVTAEKLQAGVNRASAVYEWEQAGAGSCPEGYAGGCVYLISDGRDPQGISIEEVAMSASGSDIFFTTGTALVKQDTDVLRDLYDARVGGGFPEPAEPSCSASGCQGEPSKPPVFPSATSSLFTGGQNLTAPASAVATSVNSKPKPLTRAQLLAKALKACKGKKPRRKRAACESQARKKYAAQAKSNKSHRRGR